MLRGYMWVYILHSKFVLLKVSWRYSWNCRGPVKVMSLIACPKSGGRLFRRRISLRLCEHFIPTFHYQFSGRVSMSGSGTRRGIFGRWNCEPVGGRNANANGHQRIRCLCQWAPRMWGVDECPSSKRKNRRRGCRIALPTERELLRKSPSLLESDAEWKECAYDTESLLPGLGVSRFCDNKHLRSISYGQIAHHGTSATQCSFFKTTRPSSRGTPTSKCVYSKIRLGRPAGPLGASDLGRSARRAYRLWDSISFAGSVGISESDQAWPCG